MLDRTDRYSHYRRDNTPIHLQTHQQDVATRVQYLASDTATTSAGTPVREVVRIVALVHDFGKLTTTFQRHLDGESVNEATFHAPLGAFAGFYALRASGYDDTDALLGFVAIAKHHGTLPDVAEYVFSHTHPGQPKGKDRIPTVRNQIEDIDKNAAGIAEEILADATDGAGSWSEFVTKMTDNDWLLEILLLVTSGVGEPKSAQTDTLPNDFYDGLLPVWSTVTFADKTSAAALTSGADLDTTAYDGKLPSLDRLTEKIETLKSDLDPDATADEKYIHNLRGDAHEEVMAALDDFVTADAPVASITLPTGLGKTLTGLNAGLELLSRRENDGRLIYALPFTSIIDQVASECREIFGTSGHDDVLTIDHHLAETIVDMTDLEALDPDTVAHIEELLGESWRSGPCLIA